MKYAKVRFKDNPTEYIYSCDDSVQPGNVAEVYVLDCYETKQVQVIEVLDEISDDIRKKFDIYPLMKVVSPTIENTIFDEKGEYHFTPIYEVIKEWHNAPLCNFDMEGALPHMHIEFKKPKFRGSVHVFKCNNTEHGLIDTYIEDLRPEDDEQYDFWASEEHFSSLEELNYMLNNLRNAIYYYYVGKIDGKKLDEICNFPKHKINI